MFRKSMSYTLFVVFALVLLVAGRSDAFAPSDLGANAVPAVGDNCAPCIDSLSEISIGGLRSREYGSAITIASQLGNATGSSAYSQFYGAPYYNTYMAAYESDGLQVYSRLDVPPTAMPADGYPVIIYSHGWVGATGAPGYKFNYAASAYYGDMLDAWVKAGYLLLMPGWRGHGTVNGVPAEGIEYVQAYDNGSYISPTFYAIDMLNLLDGVQTLNDIDWRQWGFSSAGAVKVNTKRIFLAGHSQGGDAANRAMAVSSSPYLENKFAAGSIWAGSIAGLVEQGAYFGPQEWSADAWTDPAYFAHMPSWWSPDWSPATIDEGLANRKSQMYDTVRTYVRDQANADPATNSLVPVMKTLSADNYPEYYAAPIDYHYSDMDHYSIPEWNETFVRSLRMMGVESNAYLYHGNSHEFRVEEGWSPADAVSGRATAIQRTIALFDAAPDAQGVRTITLPLAGDAWVNGGDVGANYSAQAVLTTRTTGLDNIFLAFDRSTLPQGAVIKSATLTLHVSGQSGAAGKTLIASNTGDVDLATVTYATAPSIYNPSAPAAAPDAAGNVAVDVTGVISAWDAAAKTVQQGLGYLAISSAGPQGRINIDAVETWHGSPASLTITYEQ